MTRRKNGARRGAKSQQLKDVNKQVTAAKKRAAKLLANSKKDIRQIRSEVAALKKAGLVSPRIDARSYQPTKYMLQKLEANRDVLEGRAIAVKAPPKVRKKYASKRVFEERGGALIVPKSRENETAKIKRGAVAVSAPLKNGQEERIILPYKATDMEQVANALRNDPTLDGLKKPDELFGFRLFGHNMATIGFPDADELADYILLRYQHLFNGKDGKVAVRYFELLKFKAKDSYLREGPGDAKQYNRRNKQGNQWAIDRRKRVDAARKKKQRDKETPEQRQKRLDAQRIRSQKNRDRKKGK